MASKTIIFIYSIGDLSFMQILVATIAFLLPSAEYSSAETDKKVGGTLAVFPRVCFF